MAFSWSLKLGKGLGEGAIYSGWFPSLQTEGLLRSVPSPLESCDWMLRSKASKGRRGTQASWYSPSSWASFCPVLHIPEDENPRVVCVNI